MRDLLLLVPHLTVTASFEIDYVSADPAVLVLLANKAETSMQTLHRGMAAVGNLLARTAPEIESGEVSSDAIKSLGWLIAELAEFADVAHAIAVACRKHTADFAPSSTKNIPNLKA